MQDVVGDDRSAVGFVHVKGTVLKTGKPFELAPLVHKCASVGATCVSGTCCLGARGLQSRASRAHVMACRRRWTVNDDGLVVSNLEVCDNATFLLA